MARNFGVTVKPSLFLEDADSSNSVDVEGDLSDDSPNVSEYVQVSERNARSGRVALIQLTSFGGVCLLFRSCFFSKLPIELRSWLGSRTVAKVGQGLEKDQKQLLSSFDISLDGYVDVRNVCLMWPWFVANYRFDRFGVHSIGSFLFDVPGEKAVFVPPWCSLTLTGSQVRSAAVETQLAVDIVAFVSVRFIGGQIPSNWLENEDFGKTVYFLTAANKMNMPYLDKSSLTPKHLKHALVAAAKKKWSKEMLKAIRTKLNNDRMLPLSLWAWPTMVADDIWDTVYMAPTPHTATLPCCGRPFAAANVDLLHPRQLHQTSLVCSVRDTDTGKWKKYRIKVSAGSVPDALGSDGIGRPFDLKSSVSSSHKAQQLYAVTGPKLEAAAYRCIDWYRMHVEWNKERSPIRTARNTSTAYPTITNSPDRSFTDSWSAGVVRGSIGVIVSAFTTASETLLQYVVMADQSKTWL